MPSPLLAAIEKAYPTFRMPRESDMQPEDVESNRQSGGNSCLGVASADFDGDRANDYLLGLSSRRGDGALLALVRGERWRLKVLSKWEDKRGSLYVEAGNPGAYRRTEALEGAVPGDEVLTLNCAHAAAIFGVVESTEVAWCPVRGSGRHTQFSD